jgi:glycosyltransferase involved in cell wall biosynthesis
MDKKTKYRLLRIRKLSRNGYYAIRRALGLTPLEKHFRPIVARERRELRRARRELGHLYQDHDDNPLVTVTIATWNRGRLLVERTLPSILAQTYQNLEVIIVGDHCTDETDQLLRELNDPRVRWENLPERGDYPTNPRARWQVAGVAPNKRAYSLARGRWIAHLDDDDVFTPDHIEVLLRHAQANNLELAYGLAKRERSPGVWEIKGRPLEAGGLTLFSTSLIRSYIRLFEFDINAWRIDWPGDKHRWIRMQRAGVRAGFINKVVLYSPMRPGQTKSDYLAEDREKNA